MSCSLDDRQAATTVPHSKTTPLPAVATSVWAGTLPGTMAGKRPARKSPQLVLALIASLSMHLGATTYYVAKTGNDANPGTEELPWLTIQKSISVAVAGDSVLVKAGTYDSANAARTITFSASGTAAAPIVFKSYDGWNTTIGASVLVIGRHVALVDFRILYDSTVFAGGVGQAVRIEYDSCRIDGCELVAEPSQAYPGRCGLLIGSLAYGGQVITGNTVHGFGGDGHGHGIYMHTVKHSQVTRNTVYDNHRYGIQCYPDFDSGEVAYNVCYNNSNRAGIVMQGSYTKIHDNLCYDNGEDGIKLYRETGRDGTGNEVFNNVCHNNAACGIEVQQTGNNTLLNNICVGNGGRQLSLDALAGNLLDYNCYYPDGASRFSWGSSGNFAAYKAATGQEVNSIVASPLFNDTAAHDFHLTDSSPCIDAGDPMTPHRFDFGQISAPQGAGVDIGAYEYPAYDTVPRRKSVESVSFAIAPNPMAGGFATVRYNPPEAGSATLEVFNVSGRLVRSSFVVQRSSFQVDLRSLPAGVYMVKVTAEDSSSTEKLVVF